MSQVGSRKRPAPGATPKVKIPKSPTTNPILEAATLTSDQFLLWNQANSSASQSNYPSHTDQPAPLSYPHMASQTVPVHSDAANQLARRSGPNQMFPRREFNGNGGDVWANQLATSQKTQQQNDQAGWQEDDEAELDRKALEAKKQAQAARKSIPPFVQKISSFLEESRNTDLIRWSPKGDSFVVLDEDEFARTMIPDLFKHNNYASFVRQLNMYGFHKRVGLSDNSMRASERKNKNPSEYYNPYFKRGKPNLLWLIQKPKPSTSGKKGRGKQEENEDDGDDTYDVENTGTSSLGQDEYLRSRQPLLIGQGEQVLAREELSQVHQELQAIRQQQQMISGVLQKIRREHEQLYGQAAAFQELHSRHENSINAILTFLATVYNRSLEGHGGRDIGNLFAGAIPHETQKQGTVLDMGEYSSPNANSPGTLVRRQSKKPLLLQAPPDGNLNGGNNSNFGSVSKTSLNRPRSSASSSNYQTPPNPGTIEEIYDQDTSTPIQPDFSASNQQKSQEMSEGDFMSFINSTNARDSGSFPGRMDFPEALNHLQTADGKSPLSPAQRNNVLRLIAGSNGQSANGDNVNNALTSPDPPSLPTPNMDNWKSTTDDIQYLQRTLKEQGDKVDQLSNLLQPLSPSGSIPGLDNPNDFVPQPPDGLDFIFNTDDYFSDTNNVSIDFGSSTGFENTNDFDFGSANNGGLGPAFDFPSVDNGTSGRIVETADTSEATSPANTVEDVVAQEEATSPRKRQRKI